MVKILRLPLWLARALVVASIVAPGVAHAQYREFSGRIDRVRGGTIYVDNRMGDELSFVRVGETVVEGRRSSWEELEQGDWATVSWKMMDRPRKAYRVRVSPPREP